MSEISRRKFLGAAAGGAVVVGAAAVAAPSVLGGGSDAHPSGPSRGHASQALSVDGPVLAHVRDAKTGEISVFSGTREIVIRDRSVANVLLDAAQ